MNTLKFIHITQRKRVMFVEHSQIILNLLQMKNISAYKLSKETGISESLFSKWKKNPTSDISSSTLALIAGFLGCSVDHLLGREEQEKKPTPEDGDGLDEQDRQLLELMKLLSADQKKFLLAQLLTLTGQGK